MDEIKEKVLCFQYHLKCHHLNDRKCDIRVDLVQSSRKTVSADVIASVSLM